MTAITHKGYTQSATSILTTELNALGNAMMSSASSAVDNTSNLDLFMDLELYVHTQGSARSAGATVEVYILPTVDGTNYADATYGNPELVAVFPLDAATTARYGIRRDIPIPPGSFKLALYNRTGQAFAATTSTLKYRTYSVLAT